MPNAILALNAGSSSIKFALFEITRANEVHLASKGEIEGIGTAPHFIARDRGGKTLTEKHWAGGPSADHEALLSPLLDWIEGHLGQDSLTAVGHRVVHGGRDFSKPVRIDATVVQRLDRLTPLAPLHQPHSLSPIRAILTLRPSLPQVACFDTAFHHTMPAVAARIALPREYEKEGVRRYGFHGLSYEYIARMLRETAPDLAAGRSVIAHLGNGASLCAMRDGRSIDTTMSFTALDGLVMGTRCGGIDPGVVLYMLQQKHLSPHDVEQVLYTRSGLLGVSGISSDMRGLLASSDPRAAEAIELFVFRIARETAALVGMLGGLDGFVFTAGIGEHSAEIRAAVCERLGWLGVVLDSDANARHATRIASPQSRVDVRVIPTDEEAMIARHTLETLTIVGS
jgi:acetate kinase